MKRFIDLGTQIWTSDEVGIKCFTWFDTTTDRFEIHSGESIWENWGQFESDFEGSDLE